LDAVYAKIVTGNRKTALERQSPTKRTVKITKNTPVSVSKGRLELIERALETKTHNSLLIFIPKDSKKSVIDALFGQIQTSILRKYNSTKQDKVKLIVPASVGSTQELGFKEIRALPNGYRVGLVPTGKLPVLLKAAWSIWTEEITFKLDNRVISVVPSKPRAASNEFLFKAWTERTPFPFQELPDFREIVLLNWGTD